MGNCERQFGVFLDHQWDQLYGDDDRRHRQYAELFGVWGRECDRTAGIDMGLTRSDWRDYACRWIVHFDHCYWLNQFRPIPSDGLRLGFGMHCGE